MADQPPLRDYSRSRAVVMGTWSYTFLTPVPPAENSMRRIIGMLTGPLCGWPRERLLVLGDERSPGDLPDQLITAFDTITDVALFYYVGHGQIAPDDQLCLGLVQSRPEANRRAATSLRFSDVRQALQDSPAATKIVILDCCFAGLAASNTLAGLANDVLDMTAGTGAYTMAATNPYATAWYEDSPAQARPQTFFTKYLVDLVEAGIPGQPSRLELDPLYRHLRESLAADKRPVPRSRVINDAREFVFAYNAAPPQTHRDPERELALLGQRLAESESLRAAADAQIQALQAEAAERASELARLTELAASSRPQTAEEQRQFRDAIDEAARRLGDTMAAEAAAAAAYPRLPARADNQKRLPSTPARRQAEPQGPELGKARLRKEDARLVAGRTSWTDNITLPGTLHMAFVRSPRAHAKIISVDVSAARRMRGVIAAFTSADFAGEQGSLPCLWPVTPDIVIPAHPPMAVDEVRYVGEPVALVVARDPYTAADAAEAIDVRYEPLPPVLDVTAALGKISPKVHSSGNRCYEWIFSIGDLDAAFRDAPVLLEREYRQPRLIPSAIEPRAVACSPVGDEYTLWSATQIPHVLRMLLAAVTGIPEGSIRVIAPDVGGGFGSKLEVTGEDVLALLIARRLGQPVKWTQSRFEGNLAAHHGRGQLQRIRIAADRDGRIRGLAVDLLADMGAYLTLLTPGIPLLGAFSYNSIYKMDAYSFRCTGVFTTKTPTDAYRGGGRLEAAYAIERIMDDLAAELDMDPLDLRARNWIGHQEFPYTTISGLTYDSGNYEAATARAKELFSYDNLRREQADRAARRDPLRLGIGVSTCTAMSGLAPSRLLGALAYGVGGWEHASIRMLLTGKVEVVTGSSAQGQGHETAWSQIVADKLGVPFEDVQVLHGDTQRAPKGMDTWGSRSLVIGGVAVVSACERVIAKAKIIAAAMLKVPPKDVEFAHGVFSTRSGSAGTKTIQEVAAAAFVAHNLPDGVEPSLDSEATYDPNNFSFPHGTHLCAVEVDTETGQVKIRSYVAVDDVGVVVNPLIVEGQVHGGIAQGIAQALYEEAAYDTDGNLVTATLADYLVPSAADLPTFVTDRTQTPSTTNPLGVKSAGEIAAIASTPAVVNAVIDALRPLGVQDVTMPCTPDSVWRAIALAGTRPRTGLRRK
jgi:aerobic carbon-monoxide dehydrogenase large subunit